MVMVATKCFLDHSQTPSMLLCCLQFSGLVSDGASGAYIEIITPTTTRLVVPDLDEDKVGLYTCVTGPIRKSVVVFTYGNI